jgi:glycosyltransferase involved in cell wall biosynthesis
MRIAIVNDVAGVAAKECAILRGAGHEVDFIELPKPGATWPFWLKVLTSPLRLAMYLPPVWRLRRGRYDRVDIHFVSQGIVGLLIDTPFYIHAHGSDLHLNSEHRLMRWLNDRVLSRARAVFYATPNLAAFLDSYRKKSFLLPNPIDVAEFATCAPPGELKKVLIFTRLDPVKGAAEIFESVHDLAGVVALTAMRWGLLARGLERTHAGDVTFVDRVPRSGVPALLCANDAVIGQVEQGVLGLMELEAMAAGRPVVMRVDRALYQDDPPPTVTIDGAGGIAQAVRSLAAQSAELARLSREGREWVARNHSPARHLEILLSV